jgi:DNA-binding transcriptional MerR regulator
MAFPWLMALKVIPWGDVIEHAPKVLKGARRLLDKQKAGPAAADAAVIIPPGDGTGRLAALEAAHQQLQADLAQLTQTTAELAEQNTRLVQAVDLLRWRTRWLGALSLVLLIGVAVLAFA